MTYDLKRLDEAINKISGAGLKPPDIIERRMARRVRPKSAIARTSRSRPSYDTLKNLEQVHNRRKAFIYVSDGYDFDPFAQSRDKANAERCSATTGPECRVSTAAADGTAAGRATRTRSRRTASTSSPSPISASELAELTREANRANATIYTIDPRGLVGGPDLDEKRRSDRVAESHSRNAEQPARARGADRRYRGRQLERFRQGVEADRFGNQRLLCLGYYSSNPDPTKEAPVT